MRRITRAGIATLVGAMLLTVLTTAAPAGAAEGVTLTNAITSPPPFSETDATLWVRGESHGGDVDRITLQVKRAGADEFWDGAAWQTTPTSFATSVTGPVNPGGLTRFWSHSVPGLPDGEVHLVSTAYGVDGQRATTRRNTIIDSTGVDPAPEVTFTGPSQGVVATPGNVVFSGRATDDKAVDSVLVKIKRVGAQEWWDGAAWSTTPVELAASVGPAPHWTEVRWRLVVPMPAVGEVNTSVVAKDHQGVRSDPQGKQFSVGSSIVGPEIDAPGFPSGGLYEPHHVVTGLASDDVAVTGVWFEISRASDGRFWTGSYWRSTVFRHRVDITPGPWVEWSFALPIPDAGEPYRLEVFAADADDHVTSLTGSAVAYESTGEPDVTITAPSPGMLVGPQFRVEGVAEDEYDVRNVSVQVKRVGVREFWNGAAWQPTPYTFQANVWPRGFGRADWSLDLSLPPDESVTVTAGVLDFSGDRSWVNQRISTALPGSTHLDA